MNIKFLFTSLILGLGVTAMTQVNAQSHTDQETRKHQQVCKNKQQDAQVSFAHQGVIFNGTCQPDENGKLSFQPPQPPAGSVPTTESQSSVTQSEPRPISTPSISAPVEVSPVVPVTPVTDTPPAAMPALPEIQEDEEVMMP